ncbi:Flavin-dependent oxidoreductase, luciferase family (includes alkanesulfonate monooxygenase SsuD and methylene tetrahydromethanopterin reductase) [Mycobacterium rhizamassiliense]|jgi:alkanesulfonate monooxygenase SsuD/methylene tetrahydromethanopterin reductase-like flavin-dependent oxidoreductase (luciferase family)|uniref:Flavin-dependent oxidoreductase, luciferase family (Includes alkanesulfonate monooxygenase SsuD and methylene tetrahydromethanopterin reductase) n=1 Tax=Mycobacterium rhizamassiliense TaxID=1841860 RepID=A0A2U3NNS5_9MYCO|nr:LLM class flavin-dependent oxidoreductase [Mycobacterium rhizamassiliense]SPM33170.1 Flavin-dependent oxidoreductase, luciferase family (includes alkanesulfonate monooxygenase SsuD and methylene tetrahydromethanopterin reductase) [Mycobacterium rhizamassiliense]
MTDQLHLGVALDGYGWDPQAWRATLASAPDTAPVLSGRYWAGLATTAERGLLDFLTIDDSLMPQPGRRERIDPKRLAGRGDAVLVAARVAPATRHIGLIPVATVTHTEPFHTSKAVATLDYVSHGRAGWQPRISSTTHEAALFGRRDGSLDGLSDLFPEAADYVEVVRRLWDSWEDDAIIRDVGTGRYVDIDKLHYIDFSGNRFSVKGPSITPRPPQGQPVVAVLAHQGPVYEFAAASGDLVFITPKDEASLRGILDEVSAAGGAGLKVFADVVVSFGGPGDPRSDALNFTGAATELVDLLLEWQRLGIAGARLRPAVNATDLPVIVDEVVPLLQRAGKFRETYRDGETLRERLGLPVAPNRYAGAGR